MKKVRNSLILLWSVFIGLILISSRNDQDFSDVTTGLLMLWIFVIFLIWTIFFIIKSIRLSILKHKLNKEQMKLDGLKKEYDKQLEKVKLSESLQKKIDRASELAETINKTTDRAVFYSGLNEIKNILRELIKYEGTVDFAISPSSNLQEIERMESKQIELLEKRIQEKSCLNSEEIRRIDSYNNKYDYMEGHDFERYCASILEKNGFSDVQVTPGSGDQGIDVIAYKDGVKYGIQCKCYSSDIGNKAVQEAFSGAKFYECHVPVVLTNRYFTKSAKELAAKANVLLWDRDRLNEFINSV